MIVTRRESRLVSEGESVGSESGKWLRSRRFDTAFVRWGSDERSMDASLELDRNLVRG